ncbi:hypothetical protein EV421DRAFT_1719478, partial [Armillaria borealis]
CGSALWQLGIKEVSYEFAIDKFEGCESVWRRASTLSYVSPSAWLTGQGYRWISAEAIMILRWFYITENTNTPVPKSKAIRAPQDRNISRIAPQTRVNIFRFHPHCCPGSHQTAKPDI